VSNPAAAGAQAATNVQLTDTLPGNGGLVWQTATTTQGTCVSPIVGNSLSCSLGTIQPQGSVTVTVTSTATTPAAACQSQPNNAPLLGLTGAVATADGGLKASDEGSLTCTPPGNLITVTQGGWGGTPHGNNPAAFLAANFGAISPVVIGSSACVGGKTLTFQNPGGAAAISAFLPQGGTPAPIPSNFPANTVNPTSNINVFAGQVLALSLNVNFSGKGFPAGLGSFVLPSGPAAGKTVSQVLADANKALGGCRLPSYVTSISQLNDIVDSINEMFDKG